MINLDSIISETKKQFTRDKKSIIKDYLSQNKDSVIITLIKKSRGDSIKIYTINKNYDYIFKNGVIVLQALLKNNVTIKQLYKNNLNDIKNINDIKK